MRKLLLWKYSLHIASCVISVMYYITRANAEIISVCPSHCLSEFFLQTFGGTAAKYVTVNKIQYIVCCSVRCILFYVWRWLNTRFLGPHKAFIRLTKQADDYFRHFCSAKPNTHMQTMLCVTERKHHFTMADIQKIIFFCIFQQYLYVVVIIFNISRNCCKSRNAAEL